MGIITIPPLTDRDYGLKRPVHVRILATYPAEDGIEEETFDLTYRLKPSFASTPEGACLPIMAPLEMGFDIAFPVEGDEILVEFSAEVVKGVWVW